MYPHIKKIWCTALESGEYTQGIGLLENNNTFCCLGVLCKLAEQHNICTRTEDCGSIAYDEHRRMLPVSVQNWAGIPCHLPDVKHNEELTRISRLNDDKGLSFVEIAALIREQL